LRDGADPRRAAERHLAQDATATRLVLATAPHPDPEARTISAVARELREAERARLASTQRTAEEVARHAAELRQRAGLRTVLPWTAAAREVRQADQAADLARRRLEIAEATHGDDLQAAADRAPHEAAARQREQARWEDRRDVREARERERLNHQVAAAVRAGDPAVTALTASGDLDAARAEIRRREEEARREQERHREEELRRAMEAARRHDTRPGILESSAGPRPRFGR
jgi:hypothetical protein